MLDELDILKPDVVIMGSAASYDYDKAQWLEGSVRVLSRVSNNPSASVFVIAGTPSLGFDGPDCVARHFSGGEKIDREKCSKGNRLKDIKLVVQSLNQATSRFPNVHLLDLNDLVCPKGVCYAFDEQGVVVFRDTQHLTDSFVRTRVPLIREWMTRYYRGL